MPSATQDADEFLTIPRTEEGEAARRRELRAHLDALAPRGLDHVLELAREP